MGCNWLYTDIQVSVDYAQGKRDFVLFVKNRRLRKRETSLFSIYYTVSYTKHSQFFEPNISYVQVAYPHCGRYEYQRVASHDYHTRSNSSDFDFEVFNFDITSLGANFDYSFSLLLLLLSILFIGIEIYFVYSLLEFHRIIFTPPIFNSARNCIYT
ncbi:hypothetical protein K501DRAFT_273951 [Backusella circina FSU 941]|nr:hypothetical protein K501DRAFT_273951 [Backusella circina FSU 941]